MVDPPPGAVAGEPRPGLTIERDGTDPAARRASRGSRSGARWPDVSTLIGTCFALGGFLIGAQRLADNSFFTHLATGRLILESGTIPSADPYSFTAFGEPWVVQSWLVATAYGALERLGGPTAIRVFGGVLGAILMALTWRLTRPARSITMRVVISGLVLLCSVAFLGPRPLLVGLVLMAVVLVIVTEGHDPRWLIPVLWVWTNAHGSFPLALVAIGALAAGAWLDGDRTRTPWKPLLWAGLGTLLAAINPVGPKLLTFPIGLLGKMDVLRNVVEWKSPDFAVGYSRLFLALVCVAILALVRRPSYRAAVPLVVFTAAALLGLRNIPIAALVLVPGMSVGLAGIGRLDGRERGPAVGALTAVAVVIALIVGSNFLATPAFDLSSYPTDGLVWLDQEGGLAVDGRLATEDTVGNVLELLRGPGTRTFFDDRFDMYPKAVTDDYLALHRLDAGWEDALDDRQVERVLWTQASPLASAMRDSDDWRIEYQDATAFVACRRGVAPDC